LEKQITIILPTSCLVDEPGLDRKRWKEREGKGKGREAHTHKSDSKPQLAQSRIGRRLNLIPKEPQSLRLHLHLQSPCTEGGRKEVGGKKKV